MRGSNTLHVCIEDLQLISIDVDEEAVHPCDSPGAAVAGSLGTSGVEGRDQDRSWDLRLGNVAFRRGICHRGTCRHDDDRRSNVRHCTVHRSTVHGTFLLGTLRSSRFQERDIRSFSFCRCF